MPAPQPAKMYLQHAHETAMLLSELCINLSSLHLHCWLHSRVILQSTNLALPSPALKRLIMTREACKLTCYDAPYPGCWVLEKVCSTCPHQRCYQKSWPLEHHTCRRANVSYELSLACLRGPHHSCNCNLHAAVSEAHAIPPQAPCLHAVSRPETTGCVVVNHSRLESLKLCGCHDGGKSRTPCWQTDFQQ